MEDRARQRRVNRRTSSPTKPNKSRRAEVAAAAAADSQTRQLCRIRRRRPQKHTISVFAGRLGSSDLLPFAPF